MRLALRVSEVAKALDVSPWLIYQLVASGQIPSVRLGRVVRVPVDSLRAWLGDQTGTLGDGSSLLVDVGAASTTAVVATARTRPRERPVDERLDLSVNGMPALRNSRGRGGNG